MTIRPAWSETGEKTPVPEVAEATGAGEVDVPTEVGETYGAALEVPEERALAAMAETPVPLADRPAIPATARSLSGPASLLLTLLKALKPPRWCGVVVRHC
ncbi:hypothetical protein [Kitasatospora sp. NPDC059327]|uniref:hypothetical protein n=1 Tax=Kitasatospora sp. NPDC059327 TaxID=3346803 RepID=UPI003695CD45